jgi:hypothetical protein
MKERIERLKKMYWKYKEAGNETAAKRTLARIHELGGTLEAYSTIHPETTDANSP